MNKVVEYLQGCVQLPKFRQGVSHREFNDFIDFINGLIQAAQQEAQDQLLAGCTRRLFYVVENGDVATYQIICQKVDDPQA